MFAILLIVELSAVRLFPIATLPEKVALSADTSSYDRSPETVKLPPTVKLLVISALSVTLIALWKVSISSVLAISESLKVKVEVLLSYARMSVSPFTVIYFIFCNKVFPSESLTSIPPPVDFIVKSPRFMVEPLRNKSFHFLVDEPKSNALSSLGIRLPDMESFVKFICSVSGVPELS